MNAFLVEFDPQTEKQRIVVDTNKVCGLTATGYAAQAKIHTKNFVGPSGKIYIGSKQGYRLTKDDTAEYPGGYAMIYDPATDNTENLGMPYPGDGVIDITADESRGLVYIVTCEHQHWMLYDMKTKKFRELGPILYGQPSTLVDAKGRAHALTKDGHIARYNPNTGKVTIEPFLLDGTPMTPAKMSNPTWNLAADGRTAYLIYMSDSRLMKLDLGGDEGQPVQAKTLGPMLEGEAPDSRGSLSIAPDGRVYTVIRIHNKTGFGAGYLHYLNRYDPSTGKMENLGVLAVKNPEYHKSATLGPDGKPKPWTHGFHTLPDGTLTPLHPHMAMIVTADNTVYVTIIYPFTLLKIDQFKTAAK